MTTVRKSYADVARPANQKSKSPKPGIKHQPTTQSSAADIDLFAIIKDGHIVNIRDYPIRICTTCNRIFRPDSDACENWIVGLPDDYQKSSLKNPIPVIYRCGNRNYLHLPPRYKLPIDQSHLVFRYSLKK